MSVPSPSNAKVRRAGALVLLLALTPWPARAGATPPEKLTPGQVVARHLESLGTAEARRSVSTRIILGVAQVAIRLPTPGENKGLAVLFSEGPRSALGMTFKNPEYPHDKFGFDGDKVTVSQVTPGLRSPLGDFLHARDFVLREGLLGGALSASWPLLDPGVRGAKLEYAGTKKIDGRQHHELRYLPRKGNDMSVSLFFDAETFRHTRTEYAKTVAAQMGDRSYANVQERESRYKLVEDFSDFRAEGGLTLPHAYRLGLVIDTQSGTFQGEWRLTLSKFTFNEKIAPGSFDVLAG